MHKISLASFIFLYMEWDPLCHLYNNGSIHTRIIPSLKDVMVLEFGEEGL